MKSLIQYEPGEHVNDLLVNEEEFLVSAATIFKGVPSDQVELVTYLCAGDKTDSVTGSQLKQVCFDIAGIYIICYLSYFIGLYKVSI